MIFNKKITLYINERAGIKGDDIADAVLASRRTQDFIVHDETGTFEAYCQCGFADCANRELEVQQ